MISLDVKSLYKNVLLKEAINIAVRKLYEQVEPQSLARKTMKRLLHMAVSQIHSNTIKPGTFRKMVWQWGHRLPLCQQIFG